MIPITLERSVPALPTSCQAPFRGSNHSARSIGEAQAPVRIPRKLGQRDDSNHAGTERSGAAHVLPGAFSRIEPLRPIYAVQFGAANLAARTGLLEIRQENILVRSARAVRPTLVGADIVGLVGRD